MLVNLAEAFSFGSMVYCVWMYRKIANGWEVMAIEAQQHVAKLLLHATAPPRCETCGVQLRCSCQTADYHDIGAGEDH